MQTPIGEKLVEFINQNAIVLMVVILVTVALVFFGAMQTRRDQRKRELHAQEAARAALEATTEFPFGDPLTETDLSRRLSQMMSEGPKKPVAKPPEGTGPTPDKPV